MPREHDQGPHLVGLMGEWVLKDGAVGGGGGRAGEC